MRFSKKKILIYLIFFIGLYFFATYQLPFYIQKPGNTEALNPIVEVADGYTSDGEMYLVTVSGLQATPLHYLLAKVLPHNEIKPLHEVIPEGITTDDYMHAQLQVMESSQEASLVVAYEAAEQDITIDYAGVYVVSVVEDMPSIGKLEMGDLITQIDGVEITESTDLINYVEEKAAGDRITVNFQREGEQLTEEITLDHFPDDDTRVGMGISLVTDREVTVDPEVNFSSGQIGGPSAGLMFALEIYDQLTEEDVTKGYEVAGTGEIDYEGNVYRIGGIDKKVVSADREGIDIFFAPNEDGREDSNYVVAKEKAEEIGTEMEIVPVDTFQDALEYLESIPEK
ncbi:SepM family pheromone-processing serine protease [Oceanobacillus alkalisoli]|uniref:SepM family pheromone-processing serine protease n=1 Tax=Oceanobacillus alkalisoli TaxID=2925113 RepID=UPI001EF15349|nr:SepM family pheromone-processing serine protease [Oceanobacillus alkalisoli]MCF3942535.1 PDZ domain-containing protein [Oceanobacillus alkalisoli]MCG5103592.1 PDZ domain-containing protein [Oceanobacillus alkalisoli]